MFQRELDRIERSVRGTAPTLVRKFKGNIHIDKFKHAAALLGAANPILCSRIENLNNADVFVAECETQLDVTLLDGSQDGDFSEIGQACDGHFDERSGVVRLFLGKTGEDSGYVALIFSHAVGDFHFAAGILSSLFHIYSRLIKGENVPVDNKPYLARSGIETLKECGYEVLPRPQLTLSEVLKNDRSALIDCNTGKLYKEWLDLTLDETHAVVSSAQERSTSVHGILCGSLLTEMRNRDKRSGELPMVCSSVIDLRSRLDPPVGAMEVTIATCDSLDVLHLARNASLVETAKVVKSNFKQTFSHRRVYEPLDMGPDSYLIYLAQHGVNVLTISNAGNLDNLNLKGISRDRIPGLELKEIIGNPPGGPAGNVNKEPSIEQRQATQSILDKVASVTAIKARCGVFTASGKLTIFANYMAPELESADLLKRSIENVLTLS